MDKVTLLGSLDSGEGLRLSVAVIIEDEQGEAGAAAKDIMDMFTHYVDGYVDGGEAQFEEDDIVTQLNANLARMLGNARRVA